MKIIGLCIIFTAFIDSATVLAENTGPDISKLLGGINLEEGQVAGDLETVNGGISLDDDATAENVSSVNGGFRAGDSVSVLSVKTVNGGVKAGENFNVTGDVSVINGGVLVRRGSKIGENAATVNGAIRLMGTTVGKDVKTTNGDIHILEGSVVEGDVIFRDPENGFYNGGRQKPKLIIDKDSSVAGNIYLYQKVDLDIHPDARVGKVVEDYEEDD